MANKRREFLVLAGVTCLGLAAWQIQRLNMMNSLFDGPKTKRMPVLFFGHGSPMNAIAANDYTSALNKIGREAPRPTAILMISAHWMTNGSFVTAMEKPKTIHDFYGFPEQLYQVQYPAPGDLKIAQQIQQGTTLVPIELDHHEWGLDHGTWSVLRHLYPLADIPVLQLSLNMSKSGDFHLELGQQLAKLRDHGVLIVGSGNLVHNLRRISREEQAPAMDWAVEFDNWIKTKIEQRDHKAIIFDFASTEAGRLAVPTLDHYLPLQYILGAAEKDDELEFVYEGMQNGSISMRSLKFSSQN